MKAFAQPGSMPLRYVLLVSGTVAAASQCVIALLALSTPTVQWFEISWRLAPLYWLTMLAAVGLCAVCTLLAILRHDRAWFFGIAALLVCVAAWIALSKPEPVVLIQH
jgi:hypothetical protein